MSNQGCTLHLHKLSSKKAQDALSKLGIRCAILASNRQWTSFVPLSTSEGSFDAGSAAQQIGAPIAEVWFDEDSSVVLRIHAPDGWSAEWSVPLDGTYELNAEDQRLLKDIEARKLVSSKGIEKLTQELRRPAGAREDWIRSHGIEKLLGFPFVQALPLPCPEHLVQELAPGAKVMAAGRKAASKQRPTSTLADKTGAVRNWSPRERVIVDLHLHYLTQLWSMNDWKVYNRYKRNLPAQRRREVDELINMMMTGASDEELRRAFEAILATIWDADDWEAMIRDPQLLQNERLEEAQLRDWQRRLEQAVAPSSDPNSADS